MPMLGTASRSRICRAMQPATSDSWLCFLLGHGCVADIDVTLAVTVVHVKISVLGNKAP